MSVSLMKRLTVLAPSDGADELVHRLMRLRCVDIRTVPLEEDGAWLRHDSDTARVEAERRVSDTAEALALLVRYEQPLKNKKGKPPADRRFPVTESREGARATVAETLRIKEAMQTAQSEESRTEARFHLLGPWKTYDLPLEMEGTQRTCVWLGALPPATPLSSVTEALQGTDAAVEEVFRDSDGLYLSVILHREDEEAVSLALSGLGFVRSSFAGIEGTAAEASAAAKQRMNDLDNEIQCHIDCLQELSAARRDLEALYDLEMTDLLAARQRQKLAETGGCVVLEGWIPARREERVIAALNKLDCAYETAEPAPGEEPPILLKNNGFASNFEWVVGMYAYPKYGTFDPTFVMSIFYFVIFGLMFADVGYGLLLVLGGFLVPKLLHFKTGMKRTFHMFGYCGIACTLLGVVFGGWFGDLPYAIMTGYLGYESTEAAKAAMPIFNGLGPMFGGVPFSLNPLDNPMAFLVVALGMGAVHLLGGMGVKFYLLCKDGKVLDAIFDVASYWILFAGIGLLFVNATVGWIVMGVGALLIVCTYGRAQKNPAMRVLMGFKGLYDLIGYASDLLSYSRILALGLAAAVMAQVFNLLATMGGPTVPGFILMVVILLIGHVLNIAINLLGAFVHTSRLQYLEFFSKFYEDGGEPFDPALPSEKYSAAEFDSDDESN